MDVLYLSLSSVILIDSSTGSPVHVLMLSILAVCGLHRLRAPGIVPCQMHDSSTLTRIASSRGKHIHSDVPSPLCNVLFSSNKVLHSI